MNDKSDCGKMYLCELSATEEHLLNRDERETVKLFKKSYKVCSSYFPYRSQIKNIIHLILFAEGS